MTPDKATILSWQRGTLPDRYWYQLNGKKAVENYTDQKKSADEEDHDTYVVVSKVKVI